MRQARERFLQVAISTLILSSTSSLVYAVTPAGAPPASAVTAEKAAQVNEGGTPQTQGAAPAPSPEQTEQQTSSTTCADTPTANQDPFEGFNRAIFAFNDTLDTYVMKPIAKVYNKLLPTVINQGIHNFFSNIGTLPTMANDLLQANIYQFANDSWRLIFNTTLGVGGLFDVGTRVGLPYYKNDFGLTLTAWGWEDSSYLILPFFPPSTLRDTVGIGVDYFGFSIYPYIYPQSTRYQLLGLDLVDKRAQALKYEDVMEEAAVDKYAFVRNAYLQNRAYKINENQHLGVVDKLPADPKPICLDMVPCREIRSRLEPLPRNLQATGSAYVADSPLTNTGKTDAVVTQ